MTDLSRCEICEWRCGVNREAGERGVCRVGYPEVAAVSCSRTLGSYSVTLLGCCYRCLHCNAYRISQYPDPLWWYGRAIPAVELVSDAADKARIYAEEGIRRISFTGGDPIIHLPYIEEVAREVHRRDLELGIGCASGGFATPDTMRRIAKVCTAISLEIKAFDDMVHRALTGAPVGPVLRNAEFLAHHAREAIRVFRTVVIPGITDREVVRIAEFIASLDPSIPYRLIGFRPNFVLYYHPGPTRHMMDQLARECREAGLRDVSWSGYYPSCIDEDIRQRAVRLAERYHGNPEAGLSASYAQELGCPTHPRECGSCPLCHRCPATLREPWHRI